MKIKTLQKSKKKTGVSWKNGFFQLLKETRAAGRLKQLNKGTHKRTDDEAVTMWRKLERGYAAS